ncbi:MAG TPA: helix-turn-helix domain-containing protein [Pseudonocardia sp.]|jgi:excisionase family DNA binding protein|nr:helix-turn-helix domain-containing protein [Pseudonocardia sp.]
MAEFTAATLPSRQLYRVSEAMVVLSLSRSVIDELIRSGRLRSVTEGRARLIPAGAIAAYIDLFTTEAKENDYGQPA